MTFAIIPEGSMVKLDHSTMGCKLRMSRKDLWNTMEKWVKLVNLQTLHQENNIWFGAILEAILHKYNSSNIH